MTGHHPVSELTKDCSPEPQGRIEAKGGTLQKTMALSELRQARAQAPVDLAERLQVHQPAIAKRERRTDMSVSNLRRFIAGMGGTLEMVAHFPEGSVTSTHFSDVDAA